MGATRYTASPCSHKPSKPTAKNGRAVFVWLPICGTLSEWVAGARLFRIISITLFMIQCFICNMEVDIPLTWVYWWNIMQAALCLEIVVQSLRLWMTTVFWSLQCFSVVDVFHKVLLASATLPTFFSPWWPGSHAATWSCPDFMLLARKKGHWENNEITEWNNKWMNMIWQD